MKRSDRRESGPFSTVARAVTLAAALAALAACGEGAGKQEDTAAGAGAAGTTGGTATAAAGSGQELYTRCATCHQANGEGLAGAYPPLAGSELVIGDPAIPIRIVLHGLQGPLTVKGQSYNAVMPAYGTGQPMTDEEVAAVLTYVRSSFGNNASAVTAADVARERAATSSRTTPWTAEELHAGGGGGAP